MGDILVQIVLTSAAVRVGSSSGSTLGKIMNMDRREQQGTRMTKVKPENQPLYAPSVKRRLPLLAFKASAKYLTAVRMLKSCFEDQGAGKEDAQKVY